MIDWANFTLRLFILNEITGNVHVHNSSGSMCSNMYHGIQLAMKYSLGGKNRRSESCSD